MLALSRLRNSVVRMPSSSHCRTRPGPVEYLAELARACSQQIKKGISSMTTRPAVHSISKPRSSKTADMERVVGDEVNEPVRSFVIAWRDLDQRFARRTICCTLASLLTSLI